MATSSLSLLLPLFFFLLIITSSVAKTSSRPKALLLKVTKDAETRQYVTQVSQGTPLVPVKLTLDLGGDFMWVNCERGYISSSYIPAPCGSPECKLLNNTSCCTDTALGCYNNTCTQNPTNSFTQIFKLGRVGADVVAIQSTNGKNALKIVTIPRLYFVCGSDYINSGLASGVTGMAGLGRTPTSLPEQLSSHFKFDPKFTLCLSSSTKESGVVFFGNGPYMFLPNVDASSSLTYTPLIINPVSDIDSDQYSDIASRKYFIGVTSIKVNDKHVGINKTLLSIDAKGYGGTTISTADPYTVLETSIYRAVVAAFVKAMPKNVQRVPSVGPFGACFSSKNISSTRLGPGVPSIDLVLQSKNVYWRMFGANSMVEVGKDVMCLAFVEAPTNWRPRFSLVIGGKQIEDNLLQFDVSKSRLGFSSSLLGRSTTCANFNFTSTA